MINFNEPMVAKDEKIAGIEFMRTYINSGLETAAVIVRYKCGNEKLAALDRDGRGSLMCGERLIVRNAPKIEKHRRYDEIGVDAYAYDVIVTDGKITAIELVK